MKDQTDENDYFRNRIENTVIQKHQQKVYKEREDQTNPSAERILWRMLILKIREGNNIKKRKKEIISNICKE